MKTDGGMHLSRKDEAAQKVPEEAQGTWELSSWVGTLY